MFVPSTMQNYTKNNTLMDNDNSTCLGINNLGHLSMFVAGITNPNKKAMKNINVRINGTGLQCTPFANCKPNMILSADTLVDPLPTDRVVMCSPFCATPINCQAVETSSSTCSYNCKCDEYKCMKFVFMLFPNAGHQNANMTICEIKARPMG